MSMLLLIWRDWKMFRKYTNPHPFGHWAISDAEQRNSANPTNSLCSQEHQGLDTHREAPRSKGDREPLSNWCGFPFLKNTVAFQTAVWHTEYPLNFATNLYIRNIFNKHQTKHVKCCGYYAVNCEININESWSLCLFNSNNIHKTQKDIFNEILEPGNLEKHHSGTWNQKINNWILLTSIPRIKLF